MTLTAIEQSIFNFVIANKNSYDGKLYTGMRDLLVNPTPLKLMDKQNKDKIFHLLAKFVSCLYGTSTIAKWMSKKQGDSFIDMITMSDTQLMWLSGRPMLLVAEVRGSIPAKHRGWSRR